MAGKEPVSRNSNRVGNEVLYKGECNNADVQSNLIHDANFRIVAKRRGRRSKPRKANISLRKATLNALKADWFRGLIEKPANTNKHKRPRTPRKAKIDPSPKARIGEMAVNDELWLRLNGQYFEANQDARHRVDDKRKQRQ